ncbi:hypothetical protein FGG08_002249 [Glutinoglossum americanum]|uniref:Heterokaryon incompatibility domain-containing protein n=1 Tax=Glutinoglossum americanum TaxID=1670608 RepID=A0A9P8IBX3_9PEZI|nr:hypothetical protein FGG08_002249 [Glutinoglossum americanum]
MHESEDYQGLSEYPYGDLAAPHSVRLLNLRPGGETASEIVCELIEENLDTTKVEYEALSWSWGTDPWDETIRIHHKGVDYFVKAPLSLVSALRALRSRSAIRTLWIDAICINQQHSDEKNKQVPMMNKIYESATSVCIWLGEGDDDSKMALNFIKHEVLKLQGFDELCDNEAASPKWRAMLNLMERPWFSRRWVVQEIALANDAMIYCGKETIPWKDFADAVQLFVEVETATHRLSEVMKKDPKFYHVPGWFEYVSALGASLLVDATGTLFRVSKDKAREPLLSLEYLVSSLSVFEAVQPQDTIYALLAIAKDTAPEAVIRGATQSSVTPARAQLNAWAYRYRMRKPYKVDYKQRLFDIYKEFILFSIRQSDETRALDIICRPWAPAPEKKGSKKGKRKVRAEPKIIKEAEETRKMPSWIPRLSGAAYAMFPHPNGEMRVGRQNADPLVGLPSLSQRNYSAAGTRKVDLSTLRFKTRSTYYSMYVSGFILDRVARVEVASQGGNIPEEWVVEVGWEDEDDDPPQEFWRTLVADRGRHGRNPPTYYARACRESILKGLQSGSLNTSELINNGRCSVVAEFFRRVQAVIWNRSLMRTENDHLGIVRKDVQEGDLICILYGCSVPVILRRKRKTIADLEKEKKEDEEEFEKMKEVATIRIQRGYRESVERRARLREIRLARERQEAIQREEEQLADTEGSLPANQEESQPVPEAKSLRSMNGAGKSKPKPPKPRPKPPSMLSPRLKPKNEPAHPQAPRERRNTPKPEAEPSHPADEPRRTGTDRTGTDRTGTDRTGTDLSDDAFPLEDDPKHFYYELIGECYVHGMMDGEAIKFQNDYDIKAQTFELR